MSLLMSLFTVIVNFCLKQVCRALTASEMWPTADAQDLSMFNKLAVAYTLNNVAIPILVCSIPLGINESWFEPGGAVQSAALLIVADAASYSLRVLQIPPLLSRLLTPLLARSQSKANQVGVLTPSPSATSPTVSPPLPSPKPLRPFASSGRPSPCSSANSTRTRSRPSAYA